MKIKLTNGKEFQVDRLNRSIGNSDQVEESLMVSFSRGTSLDDVVASITAETVGEFTLVREGHDDKLYKGYSIQNITEDTTSDDTRVNAFLIKLAE